MNLFGHAGDALGPHDLLTVWRFDPFVIGSVLVALVLYLRGWRPPDGRARAGAFVVALLLVLIALVSPVDAAAEVLISAHMVQHLLLVSLAAPLLAFAAPGGALLRGAPLPARRGFVSARRGLHVDIGWIRRLRHPWSRWLLFVATFWLWHASALYAAAVERPVVHIAEHVTFFGTAVLVWASIVGHPSARLPPALGVIAVFGLALQSVLLSALLTFAPSPWYDPYAEPAPGWGIDPLGDQQLAGVIMWVPSGLVHTAIGVALVVRWLNAADAPDRTELSGPGTRVPDRTEPRRRSSERVRQRATPPVPGG